MILIKPQHSKESAVVWNKISGLIASSRPLQAILSIAQPAISALIATRGLPSLKVLMLAFPAAVSGFFAVFALNDLLDIDIDKKRFRSLRSIKGWDIDTFIVRHPLAQGIITYNEQLSWILFHLTVASVLAYMLNPLCLLMFAISIALEITYCKMKKFSELKFLPTGMMVAFGALAGWYAVTENTEVSIVLSLFFLFFAWEIGGRNIVNDFSDIEEDKQLGIKTVPAIHGLELAAKLTLLFALLTVLANIILALTANLGLFYLIISTVMGTLLMLIPGIYLIRKPDPAEALRYFNKGSLYPFAILAVLLLSLYLPVT